MAEITQVLVKLLESTDSGKVDWKPTVSDQEFAASIGSNSVLILRESGATALTILDSSGREIERVGSWFGIGKENSLELSELYDRARRIALDVESQLEELLNALESES